MRLHRFFCPEPVGSRSELTFRSNELVDQLRRVLHIKIGEDVIIFDGSGSDYRCAVARFDGADRVVLDVRETSRSRYMPMRKLFLYGAVVKKDNFEFIVEKATELGVTDIIPVIAERSEKKAVNMERLNKIAIEASEQSGRGDVPVVHSTISFKEAIDEARSTNNGEIRNSNIEIRNKSESQNTKLKTIAFHTEGDYFNPETISNNEPIAIFIGPEGGWSPDEIAMFHANDIVTLCLGRQVLRTETAVIAALSRVVFD